MHSLLGRLRENETALQSMAESCERVLQSASQRLEILNSLFGDEELIKAVADEQAQLHTSTYSR